MSYWSGRFDMHEIDTTAGAAGPFAPPPGWDGDAGGYRALLRDRFGAGPATRQQMGAVALRRRLVTFRGPWAAEALDVVEQIARWAGGQGRAAA